MVRTTIDESACKGCGLCTRACPKHILQLSKSKINAKGYHPAELTDPAACIGHPAELTDPAACIGCASCARTCPDVAIHIEKD